jgi:hypothetical protein
MIRRCITLLVIVGLCVSQLAAVPHAHAGNSENEQQKHNANPHFHWSWWSHEHHGHDHLHGGHHHKHDGPSEPGKKSPSPALPERPNNPGHDATAIYCPGNATAVSVEPQHVATLSLLLGLASFALCQPDPVVELHDGGLDRGRPPDKVLDDSNIYLTLRNLRI